VNYKVSCRVAALSSG